MKNLSDDFLMQYSQTAITTSVNLFFGAAAELYLRESAFTPQFKLALMDSFRIHARALLFFLYPHNPKKDDSQAQHFMKPGVDWSKVRKERTLLLINLQERVGKEVAHLTYTRPYKLDDVVDWDIAAEARDLDLVLRDFISYADRSKLHINVIEAPNKWRREFRHFYSLKQAVATRKP